jgi:hypothetical protein
MNFAFVTLLLLFISIPGIAIRKSYYSSRFSINYISTNLINELIWSFIPAIFLNAIAIIIIESKTDYTFRLDYFGYLVTGGNDKHEINDIFNNIHLNIKSIILYISTLTVIAIILGYLARATVRGFGLDILFRVLRFPNRWHYLFTGEYLDMERGLKYHNNIDFIIADVLMDVGDEKIIYSGILEDYYLSKTSGGLDRIIIKYPAKKTFTPDGSSDYREIPGNYLSIPYDKILNINIQYYEFDQESEEMKN